jgi:hypothetical protein
LSINKESPELSENQNEDFELPEINLLDARNSIFATSSYSASVAGIA